MFEWNTTGIPVLNENLDEHQDWLVHKAGNGLATYYCKPLPNNGYENWDTPCKDGVVHRPSNACHARCNKGVLGSLATKYYVSNDTEKKYLNWILSRNGPHRLLFDKAPPEKWALLADSKNVHGIQIPDEISSDRYLWPLVYNLLIMTRDIQEHGAYIKNWEKLVSLGMHPADAYVCRNLVTVSSTKLDWTGFSWYGGHAIFSEGKGAILPGFRTGDAMLEQAARTEEQVKMSFVYTSVLWSKGPVRYINAFPIHEFLGMKKPDPNTRGFGGATSKLSIPIERAKEFFKEFSKFFEEVKEK